MSSSPLFRLFLFTLLTLAVGINCAQEINSTGIALNNLNALPSNDSPLQKGFVVALQLGGALTLIIWATIRSIHTRKKIYIAFVATLSFAVIRLFLTQLNTITTSLSVTEADIYLLNPFLNLGTMINGLYTAHLATTQQETQEKRKRLFKSAYILGIAAAISSLFIQRPVFIGIALTLIIPMAFVIVYDLVFSIRHNQEGKRLLALKIILLSTILLTFSINIIAFIHGLTNASPGFTPPNTGLFAFILCGLLFIYMVTVLDQRAAEKNTLDAFNAIKSAADESELRQNQQRFLSMLMHEIRTPLSVIKIGADALTKPNYPNESQSIWTQRIDTAIDNIAQVIDNCVQAEKQESGLIQPTINKYKLKEEIENLHREYLSANSELESRIKFNIDIKTETSIITDINYVRSILLNLISNAYKYSEPFSTIYVRVLHENKNAYSKILFQVENTIGKVETPDPELLFQRYYRSESAKKFAGTGLGLWLSQTLANQIGSHIEMKTTDQQSIIFYFSLQAAT